MDLSDLNETIEEYGKNNTWVKPPNKTQFSNYIENVVDEIEKSRSKVESLIDKLGKVDSKFLTAKPDYSKRKDSDERIFDLVRPEVLIEKVGNCNKGVITGPHIDYGDLKSERIKYKEEHNLFKMWVDGKIQGSLLIKGNITCPENVLTNEKFFGCSYPKINTEEDWKELTKDL